MCLPVIVLAEGFNINKSKFGFSFSRLGKVVIETLFIGVLFGFLIYWLLYALKGYVDPTIYQSFGIIQIVGVVIPMCTFNSHGGLGPIHRFHNER